MPPRIDCTASSPPGLWRGGGLCARYPVPRHRSPPGSTPAIAAADGRDPGAVPLPVCHLHRPASAVRLALPAVLSERGAGGGRLVGACGAGSSSSSPVCSSSSRCAIPAGSCWGCRWSGVALLRGDGHAVRTDLPPAPWPLIWFARLHRALEDREAIRELIAQHGPAADAGDAEAVAGLWATDGVSSSRRLLARRGHAAIAADHRPGASVAAGPRLRACSGGRWLSRSMPTGHLARGHSPAAALDGHDFRTAPRFRQPHSCPHGGGGLAGRAAENAFAG